MKKEDLWNQWKHEEEIAHIHGWDFSHLDGRYAEGKDIPWDYRTVVRSYLTPEMRLLDIDTGGGEFLLSLGHPYKNTSATEGYPPNAALCRSILQPLGVAFREAADVQKLPFPDESFDVIINRHGDFFPPELFRLLKPGGIFVTQQVGAENDRELVDLLLPGTKIPYPEQYAEKAAGRFRQAGFEILQSQEFFGTIRFYDAGALVWFARVIPWEFPGFSVDACLENLWQAQEILEKQGGIRGRTHRYLLAARKPV